MWAIFSYQNRPKPPNKCQDLPTVHFLSSNEINNYNKLAAVFRTDLTVFYDLYIDDRGLEDFMVCLEECKSQGCTMFICFELKQFESSARTYSCVLACKENDEKKLSQFVEQIQKRNDPNDYHTLHKTMSKNDELRSFLTKHQAEEYGRFEINLNRSPPKLNVGLSVQSKKQNIAIAQKAKHLKLFISQRLAHPVLTYPTVDSETLVQETTSVLKTNLKKLVNGTPPNDIKETYKAVLLQLCIFHQNRYSFLRNSINTNTELSNLEESLNFVTAAIKCLNYGMKDGNWCVLSGDELSYTVEEAVINVKKQPFTANTVPASIEDQSFLHDPVEEAETNNDSEKLNKLNADIDAIIKYTADPSLRVLPEQITALDTAEVELAELRAKYDKIQLFDDIHAKAIYNLLKHIDRTFVKLKSGRNRLQTKLNTTVTKRQTEAIKIHMYLSSLIREGHELLLDKSADPRCSKDLADKIQRAMDADNGNVAFRRSEGNQNLVKPLANIIPVAEAVKEAINHRHNLYLEFVKRRDNAKNQLDASRQILDAFENETVAASRPLDAAEQALEVLKNAHADLRSQAPILERLQKLSEELDPLDSVYADVRLAGLNWDQLNQKFEDIITELNVEIDAEKLANEIAAVVVAEIDLLEAQIPTSGEKNLMFNAEQLIPVLNDFAETAIGLVCNRRYVAPAAIPPFNDRLEALTVSIVGRVEELHSFDNQEQTMLDLNQPSLIEKIPKSLKSARDCVKHLPDNADAKAHVDSVSDALEASEKACHVLVNRTRDNPESEDKLVNDQNAIINQLNKLGADAIAKIKSEDLDGKPTAPALEHDLQNSLETAQLGQKESSVEAAETINRNQNPIFTLALMGRSDEAKLTLLKSVCCVLQNETFEAAISQNAKIDISEKPEEYIIQHGVDNIRFVNVPVNEEDYENADVIGSKLSEYPEIHGIITVITNDDSTLPDAQYNQLCFTYKLLFRNAFKNCCIVNVFKPNDTFNLDAASAQLMQFLKNFCERHRLTDVPLNSFCVDAPSMQSIPNVNLDETQLSVSRNAWQHVSNGFKGFLKVIKTDKPLKARSFHLTAKLRRLENWLNIRRREIPTPPPVEWRFLLEMVADSLMSGLAIYYRNKVGDASPLTNDQLQNAVNYWQTTDVEVAKILFDIKQLF